MTSPWSFEFLRSQIVGIDSAFDTPFGRRLMVYCDYTASGRCLAFVERYLQNLQRIYANTHTEDDLTGRSMSRLLHEAERAIKASVNAGPRGRIVACGTGATGAIDKLQQITGVALPPATRRVVGEQLREFMGARSFEDFRAFQQARQPVVFVGPYEHHSNEVTWRQGLATVVEVNMTADGGVDLSHLEQLLQAPEYQGRLRIGSFSAASNVTGMRSPTHEIARLLHAHEAYACFDYAASAPYVEIDMNPPPDAAGDASYDAVFLSPHKFLGGPGSSGVLVFNERLYASDLPPSVAGGGTVDYVSPDDQDFIADVEEREKAGTPGVLQIMKAALALQVKDRVGVDRIEAREHALLQRAPVRHPIACRVLLRRTLRPPPARHRRADLRALSRLGAEGLPGHQARLVPRRFPLLDGRRRGRLRDRRGAVRGAAWASLPAAVRLRCDDRALGASHARRTARAVFSGGGAGLQRLRAAAAAVRHAAAALCREPGGGGGVGRAAGRADAGRGDGDRTRIRRAAVLQPVGRAPRLGKLCTGPQVTLRMRSIRCLSKLGGRYRVGRDSY
jgi:selenocysteine lyase/cysteine desulfurase